MDHLTEQDAGLLEQAASMLEGLANDERDRGNCSAAEGAACSAHAIRRLAPALLRAGRGCLAQIEEPAAPAAVSPQGERQWICPTRTVADLVNNLLTMDQALPVYGAQYIEKDGRRCAIAVPPTVSRERVKDGRWIGQGEELNAAVVWTRAEQPVAAPGLTDGQLDDESYRVNDEPGFADAFRAGARFAERVHGVTASAVRAVTGKADWWRGRADEIEVRVARSGSQEAMRCYTDMRTLLQAAAPALEAPPHQCCNSWFASLPEGRQAVLRDDKWMLASAAYEAGRESCSALEAPAAPAGWKLVPVQDNPSMWTAGGEAIKSCGGHERDAASLAYKAMLAAAPQAPAAPVVDEEGHLSEELRDLITGMTVSVDVSTGEHDASNRLFGEVTEVMEYDGGSDKHKVVLLVQSPEANFKAAPAAPSGRYKLADDGAHQYLDGIEARYSIEREDGTTVAWVLGNEADSKELMAAIGAAPAAPAVDAELLELAQAIVKFNREHGSVLAVHIDNLADLVDERAAQAAAKGEHDE